MSTPNTDTKTPTTKTRTRGRALLPAPATEALIAAQELANNPKALELAQKLAKVEGERDQQKRLADSRLETLQGRNKEIQTLKTADLTFRAAIWGAIETLSAGTCTLDPTDPRWVNTPPAEMAGLLVDAVEYGRIGIEMTAVVEELLQIEGDPKHWGQQVAQALADRIEAAEGPLRAERDHYKAEAELYQTSTNNLGGMVKWQARNGVLKATLSEEAFPGDALANDLPTGLLRGLRWPTWLEIAMWAVAGLAFYAGWLIGGAK